MSGIIDYRNVFQMAGKPKNGFYLTEDGRMVEQTPAVIKAIQAAKIKAANPKKRKRTYPENAAGKLHLMQPTNGPQTFEQLNKAVFKTPRAHAIAFQLISERAQAEAAKKLGIKEVAPLPVESKYKEDHKPKPATLPQGFFDQPAPVIERPAAEVEVPYVPEIIDEPDDTPTEPALRRMNKRDLMSFANSRGIDMSEARNKDEMVSAILNNL